jgi:hypothetical protein
VYLKMSLGQYGPISGITDLECHVVFPKSLIVMGNSITGRYIMLVFPDHCLLW